MDNGSDKWLETEGNKDDQSESNHSESSSNAGRLYTVPHFSEQEAKALEERIVNNEAFGEASKYLITWLERGECNERNSEQFYFLLNLCRNRVDQLKTEQQEYQLKAERAEKNLVNKFSCMQKKLNEMEDIFKAIEKLGILCNFTQDEEEEMLMIRKDILNLLEEIEEKGLSNVNIEDVQPENVACQFQTKVGRLICEKSREKNNSIEISDDQQKIPHVDVASQCDRDQVIKKEVNIISLVSIFLFDHPGENIDSIYSHLNRYIPDIHKKEIESVLRRNPHIFKESSSVEDKQNKWIYLSLNKQTMTELLSEH